MKRARNNPARYDLHEAKMTNTTLDKHNNVNTFNAKRTRRRPLHLLSLLSILIIYLCMSRPIPVFGHPRILRLRALNGNNNNLLTAHNSHLAPLESASSTSSPSSTSARSISSTSPPAVINKLKPSTEPASDQSNPKLLTQPLPTCSLGNDTYRLGERWNPNLPPFGIQVCVQCECVIRPKKYCYETKVTCRRITNECPIIESCPDGKKPVTIEGQCCKSCQISDNPVAAAYSAYDSESAEPAKAASADSGSMMQLKNEPLREYQSIMSQMEACARRETMPTTQPVRPMTGKSPKGGKYDINGIDTKIIFKSLDDSQGGYNYPSLGKSSRTDSSDKSSLSSSSSAHKIRTQQQHNMDDSLRQDHQHPNDVQTAAGAPGNRFSQQASNPQTSPTSSTTRRPPASSGSQPANTCLLGDEVFQVGDRWNPNLPQIGVQVCVECNCMMRQRKARLEPRVTCRRINNECSVIDSCPSGQHLVTPAGQCCKSCQAADLHQEPQQLEQVVY